MPLIPKRCKRYIVAKFLKVVDSWNQEFHELTQQNVMNAYKQMFPHGNDDLDAMERQINDMRNFYFSRIAITASLLIGGASLVLAFIAIIVAVISVLHT